MGSCVLGWAVLGMREVWLRVLGHCIYALI
jgi:hypothetical protein